MKNLVYKEGDQIEIATAVAYLSGDIVVESTVFMGIAVADAVDGKVTIRTVGAYELDAEDASYTVGQVVSVSGAQGEIEAVLGAGGPAMKVIEAVTVSGNDNKVKALIGGL